MAVQPSLYYGQAVAKGRSLFQALEQRLNDSTGSDVQKPNIDLHYHQDSWGTTLELGQPLANALNAEHIVADDWEYVAVMNTPTSGRHIRTFSPQPREASSVWTMTNRMIIAHQQID